MKYLRFADPDGSPPVTSRIGDSFWRVLAGVLSPFVPRSNPEQERLYDQVVLWKIEFDTENHSTSREIGFDRNGKAIVAAPLRKDLGLWTDEELTLQDYAGFDPIEITK